MRNKTRQSSRRVSEAWDEFIEFNDDSRPLTSKEGRLLRRLYSQELWSEAMLHLDSIICRDGPGPVSLLVCHEIKEARSEIEALWQATDDGTVNEACEYYLAFLACRPQPSIPSGVPPFDDIMQARISRLPLADKMLVFRSLRRFATS